MTAPAGTWTAANDGSYTVALLAATAKDEVGNSAAGGAWALSRWPWAPSSRPPQAHVSATSDTGAFNNDNVTDLNNSSSGRALKLLVPGTDAGATVKVYSGAALIASGVAGGSSITLTTNGSAKLPDGANLLTATQTDPGERRRPPLPRREFSSTPQPHGNVIARFDQRGRGDHIHLPGRL